jgi:hypothetical protein
MLSSICQVARHAGLQHCSTGLQQNLSFADREMTCCACQLQQKMQGIIRTSGYFNGDLTPGRPSRARLDVIRIVFAMYCDSVTVYKPILSLIQREYEAHVSQIEEVQNKQIRLEDDLAADQDVFQAQASAMKARWKEKLKKANDAVFEWKNLYEELVKEREKENAGATIRKQKEEMKSLRSRIDELEAENRKAIEENDNLAKQANQVRLEASRIPELQRENLLIKAQLELLTNQLAESKTAQEVQKVHYIAQTREFSQLKLDVAKLRKQVEVHENLKGTLTPRPDWQGIASTISSEVMIDPQASTSYLVGVLAGNVVKSGGDKEAEPQMDEEIHDETEEGNHLGGSE